MTSNFYLPRNLSNQDKTYTEAELISTSNYVVVLAEPGGGKTALMESLALQLGTTAVTASTFAYVGAVAENIPLVIDAFDELAKVDASGIYKLFGQAKTTNPTHIYLSSRSSEWDEAATNNFKNFFGQKPLVVRLFEFGQAEQRAIFDNYVHGEDFTKFQAEVARFDLETLLPNPQFLKLFADAYIESGRRFLDKRSIFSRAVERLAKEANTNVKTTSTTLSINQKIELSSEVFAKLLLSGAEGICTSEATEDRIYPLLTSLFNTDVAAHSILATRLFKLGDRESQHRPVHKIVAEYCAASYLTRRIADPADPLTLSKCLPIIAPNSTVRDELRGLLGWMAALGNKPIEEAAIKLDPYSVLANGDPSQIENSSKKLLINSLKEIEEKDPYFRRGDFRRKFSAAGFFTQDVIEEIKPLLADGGDGHLRNLILELLVGSPAIVKLQDELLHLILNAEESDNTRFLANRCVLEIAEHYHLANLEILISEGSHTSLGIAAEIIVAIGSEAFEQAFLANFFHACTKLYPDYQKRFETLIGARYFIKNVIAHLALDTIEGLLDNLTRNLVCKCSKKSHECNCLNGISKIVGSMLDRFFELTKPPYDAKRVWQWVGNLNFHEQKNKDQSNAVQVLQEDVDLRQGIIAHAFERLTNRDEIADVKLYKFNWRSHSGLHLYIDDYQFLVDLAFKTDNIELWNSFMAWHQSYRKKEDRGPDRLRRHMRDQALKKPLFMQAWVKANRVAAELERKNRIPSFRHNQRMRRNYRKQNEIRVANIKFVNTNRELVESGRHWGLLVRFAELVLNYPDKIQQEFGDETLVRNALRNCLDFISPKVPNLLKLAELQCASQGLYSEMILYAACLEIMRVNGSLDGVDFTLLQALRTDINIHYQAVSEAEREALKIEVDRLIFPDPASAEKFLRQYLEPQIAQTGCNHPDIWLLQREKAFSHLRAPLSVEWLRRFHTLPLGSLDRIFEIAAQYGNRDDLKAIIVERCSRFMHDWPNPTNDEDIEQRRIFWFVRAWYFLDDTPETYWNWLKEDKDILLVFYGRSGQMNRGEFSNWPKLTSRKIESILNAFVDIWPKIDLPNHWGSDSPKEENAYRFITELIWSFNSDDPDDAIPVIERLLSDSRFDDQHKDLRSMRASQFRKKALRDFKAPTPQEIVNRLDHDTVVTVEGLRQLLIQELQDFQNAIDGGEFNPANRFYEKGERLGEVSSTEIIAERLSLRLEPQGISVVAEHQLKDTKRSDFTATKMIAGKRRLLVTEVKGQWHRELYSAAATQLHERYSIHQDAEQQGIFLVIWFGSDEEVAGCKGHGISSAQELKSSIEKNLSQDLALLIDVFVLDVSRSS